MLTRVNLWHIKREIKEHGIWYGYIVADNVNPYHVMEGWRLGAFVVVHDVESLRLNESAYLYYNHDAELWNHRGQFHYYEV